MYFAMSRPADLPINQAYRTYRIFNVFLTQFLRLSTYSELTTRHLMKLNSAGPALLLSLIPAILTLGGCGQAHANDQSGEPPPPKVVPFGDGGLFSVEHPEQFPLAAATEHATTSELVVTGAVTPDVSRNVPVVSLASGRVMAIHTRLGDTVQKGQLLMTIRSDDVSGGYST